MRSVEGEEKDLPSKGLFFTLAINPSSFSTEPKIIQN